MTEQKAPLVSVVMPSYNHARFIGRAVESVLGQTCADLELIVIDNNSNDGTDAVLAAIKDPRLRVIKFSNGGVIAASRNQGIKQAAGRYVAFIDSDDAWLPAKLEKQAAGFAADEGLVLSYCRFQLLEGETVKPGAWPRAGRYASGDIFRALYLSPFIACSGVMARRDALLEAGCFDEDPGMLAIEDVDLWLRLALKGRSVCSSKDPLFLYRVHGNNLSQGVIGRITRVLRVALKYYSDAGPLLFFASTVLSIVSILRRRFFP